MIGDGWDSEPSVRPGDYEPGEPRRLRIAVVTGTRAEFGLLRPVMHAIEQHPALELLVIAAGSHLILPALTFRDVKAHFKVADSVPMQVAGKTSRFDDAEATGRGVARFARSFEGLRPDWIVVLGDRIEAFAAAAAASIAGYPLAHIHGGDRAEGIADESMRHAITKLANLHFPATAQSAERIIRMGERKDLVHAVGSPAMDDLPAFGPLAEGEDQELGAPNAILLMHPIGRTAEAEEAATAAAIEACRGLRLLALHPNHDPGRQGVLRAIAAAGVREVSHLPRPKFVGLLRRIRERGGLMLGNSSAGLIEAAAIDGAG